jgi:hypothetical protein
MTNGQTMHTLPGSSQFPTTRWSLVVAAGDSQRKDARSALVSLCEHYWYPLYAYLRRRGYRAEEAQDLTQEFFIRVLEGRSLDRADPEKGRFRSLRDCGGQSDAPYAALAQEMNTSEGALKVAIHRLRKRYRELFRQEIADTVGRPPRSGIGNSGFWRTCSRKSSGHCTSSTDF